MSRMPPQDGVTASCSRKGKCVQVHTAQWKSVGKKELRRNTQQRFLVRSAHSRTTFWQTAQRGVCLLLSEVARPVRFICTGGAAALFQLALLDALVHQGWNPALANIIASLFGAQVNFVLSFLFTWRDRHSHKGMKQVLGSWIAYHASITGTLLLNQLLFLAARPVLPLLLASMLGTGVAAVVNFVIMDRVVFSQRPTRGQA